MGDYYHHFLSSMSGAGMHPGVTPEEMFPPPNPGMPLTPVSIPGPYQQLGYFTGFPEPMMFNAGKSQKGRRKSGAGLGPGVEHVKHRRTRSGCFMCRSRRVKCDETRPICERCRKGNRECVYPDPPTSKGSSGASTKSKESTSSAQTSSPSSNGDEEEDFEQEVKLETILDEDEPDEQSQSSSTSAMPRRLSMTTSQVQQLAGRQTSETPSREGTKSSSPSVSTTTPSSLIAAAYPSAEFPVDLGRADWSHLPSEFQHCLAHFVDNMTHYHYCLPSDADDFFRTILPSVAVKHEPLLNALVGFSAYHLTLQNPNGKLQDFLQYYNRSVTLLLEFLKRKEKHNVATLLTILQLATIEEYLGDWVNLMGHQKAAFEILTKMFTPQTIMQTPMGRMCLSWYARFDNFVALMGGFPTDLPREWFSAMVEYHRSQKEAHPEVLRWKIDECSARLRTIGYDMSILYSRGSRSQISPEQFIEEHNGLTAVLVDWKDSMDPALVDPNYLVKDSTLAQPPDPDDIVDPYNREILYDFPLFTTTLLCAEWNSIMIMHKCQSSGMRPDILFGELRQHAYATCQYFETLYYWPSTPKGVLILIQACIAIAALFLPQDARHHMWFRRKFALLETMGYIHPITLRTKMGEMFREPSCARWWLPDDEGFSPVLQNIRSFADERNAAAVTAQQENLREVRHIFAKMELNDPTGGSSGKGKDPMS
ncbi:Fc.00g089560.m01.CDS01 [Cosmosporella sp. VM-42]